MGTNSYYCVVSFSEGGCNAATSATAVVTVNPLPTISAQPTVLQTICVGGSVPNYSVSYINGYGTPTYQWYTNTTGTANPSIDTPVGTNSSSYTPAVFTATGNFYYYAVITLDGSGCGNVTSLLGQVRVVADPTVTITPTTQTICQNTTPANLEVVVTGGEGTSNYQWYKVVTSGDIAVGTNSPSFTPPTNVVGTTNYYCVVTQTGSGCQVTSAISTVIVVPAPSISTEPLATQTVCIDGAPTTLTVAYENGTGPAAYQWYQIGTPNDIAVGTNSPSFIPPTNVVGTNSYYCVVSFSEGGCGSITSNTATININPLGQVDQVDDFQVCHLASVPTLVFTTQNDPSNTSYSWTSSNPLIGLNPGNGNIPSFVATNLTNQPIFSTIEVIPTYTEYGVSCIGLPMSFIITVNPTPIINDVNTTTCSEIAFDVLPVNGVNNAIVPFGTTYNWSVIPNSFIIGESNEVNQTSISQLLENTSDQTQIVRYTVTPVSGAQGFCPGPDFTVNVTVLPKPKLITQNIGGCSGDLITLSPITNLPNQIVPSGTTYTWTYIDNPNVLGEANGGPATIFSQTLVNGINVTQIVEYEVTPISMGCAGNPFTINVAVSPKPSIFDYAVEVCSGNSFVVIPQNGLPDINTIVPANTQYTWTTNTNLFLTGYSDQTIPQTSISQVLLNSSNIAQELIYYVTPISDGCQGTPFEIVVTVNPTPAIFSVPQLTDTRCSGEAFVIVPQNAIPDINTIVPANTTYTWTVVPNPNLSGWSDNNVASTTISQQLFNLTNINQNIQYIVTPKSGDCIGQPFTVLVWIEPKPYIPTVMETVCDGDAFILTPINGVLPSSDTIIPDLTLYSWTASTTGNVTGYTTGTNEVFFNSGLLQNGDLTVQTVTYTVTPTYYVSSNPGVPRCVGEPFSIIVSVNPGVDDNAVVTNIACSYSPLCEGSIEINPVGIGPFTYNWSYTGTFTNNITDPTAQNQYNLCPGNYEVKITDGLNCTYTFNYVIQPPSPIVSTLTTLQNISCNNVNVPPCDGYIELAVSGGTPLTTPNSFGQLYLFEWYKETSPGNYTLIAAGNPFLLNACEGIYKLKVIDANGCTYWSPIYEIENQFTLINIVETISNYNGFEIACNGGNSGYVHTVISGGSGTYNYSFTNQAGVVINSGVVNATTLPTPPGSVDLNFNNLLAGNYTLTINDPFCPYSIVKNFVLDEPSQLVANSNLVSIPIQCYGGTATYLITAVGGTGNYTGTGTYILAAGVHDIIVTDTNGCSSTTRVTVLQPSELQASAIITSPILCYGGTAQVTVTATGGVAPYSGTGVFTVLDGSYSYTITDANGCTDVVTIIVTQPGQLNFVIDSVQNPTCNPDRSYSNGSICITITGGTNPFPVGLGWTNNGNGEWCFNNLTAGTYIVDVTDVNNCPSKGSQSITLTRPTPLQAFINTNIQVDCANGSVSQNNYVFASGGTPPYTFSWSGGNECNPANPQCMTTTVNGNYIAYVNDAEGIANGCPPIEVPFSVNLITIGDPSFTYSSYALDNCSTLAINDPIVFTNTSTGDYSSISWTINGQSVSNQESFTHTFNEEGDYTVTLTVNYTIAGITCTYSTTEVVKITKGYDVIVPNAFTPNGDGINDTIRPLFKCLDKMEMSIYDTWGSLLYFEEGLSLLGWDGKINGKEAENGNYIIVVRATTFAGKELFINGPVTLIK